MDLATRAEVLKLARLLKVAPEKLDYLGKAAPEDIAALREQVTEILYAGDHKRLDGLAKSARHLPDAIVATISEHVFGPLLSARVAGLIEPNRAVGLAKRLSAPFLAQLGAEIDPRRVTEVIAQLPVDTLAGGAREMAARGEHVAMGRFVGHLSDVAIEACMAVLSEADLLRIGFVLEGAESSDRLLAMVPDDRLAKLGTVAQREGLEQESLYLFERLGPRQQERMRKLVPELADA
jgi:hypothetical protein